MIKWLDVRAFGAAGDGVGDDTVAIQTALDVANLTDCKEVRLPPGTYSVSGLVFNGNGIALVGTGSAYRYESSVSACATLQARAGTTTVVNMAPILTTAVSDPRNCLVKNIRINGNSIATTGIKVSGCNIIEGVEVSNCNIGFHLANYTNTVHLERCVGISNSQGMLVDGASTTTFSASRCNFSLNSGSGAYINGGVQGKFKDCIFESNTTYGVLFDRPDGYDTMGQFFFHNCWLEDNGTACALFDSDTRTEANAVFGVVFDECHLNASGNNRLIANFACVKDSWFRNCTFRGTTLTTALASAANTYRVGLINCKFDSTTAPATQIQSFVASGARNFVADTTTKFAPSFTNSWVNQGGSHAEAKYWHNERGDVCLQGNIRSGAVGQAAFTLPVGYRPASTRKFPVVSTNAFGEVEIQADGDVIPVTGDSAGFNLDGVWFPTD